MSVKMTLTFNDLGSPGLKALQALIDGLGPKVTGLSQRFNTLERSIEKVGTTAQNTTTKLGAYDAAIAKTTATTNTATTATTGMDAAVAALMSAIRGMTGVVNGLVTAYGHLNTAANGVAAGMNAATGGMAGANAQLAQMQGRVHGITHALEGMAQVWAAQKIFKAGGAAATEASEMELVQARLKALNLTQAENNEILQKSAAISKEMKFISTREAMEARIGAITGIGRNTSELTDPKINNIIEKTLPVAIKTARILSARGDKSEIHDIIRNLYGIVEARGQTSHPELMNQTFDLMQRALASTGGKVTIRDMESVFRNMKYGSRALIDDEGVMNVVAYVNQLKASGTGGGGSGGQGVTQAGTIITMMTKIAEAGVKNKETANMLRAMGLYEGRALGDSSTTSDNMTGGLKNSAELLRDPTGWVMKYFAPAAVKFARDNPEQYAKGRDINDPRVMDEAIAGIAIRLFASMGGQNVGQGFAVASLAGPASQIQSEVKMTKNAKDINASFKDLEETFNQNVKNFEGALKNLELALGQHLLPALTRFLELGARFVTWLNDVASANPASTQLTVIALGLGAIALVLSGLNKMFGIFTVMRGFFTGLAGVTVGASAAVNGWAAAWAGASTSIGGVLAVMGLAIKRAIPLFGAFLVGWDLGLLVGNWEVAGRSMNDWMQKFIGWMDRSIIKIRTFFGLISDEQRRALIAQGRLQGPGDDRDNGNRDPSKGPVQNTGFRSIAKPAPGSPNYSKTPEELLREKNEEDAKKLKNMKYTPLDRDAEKTFYNPEASKEKQAARLAAAEEYQMLRVLDAKYRANQISVASYYDTKRSTIVKNQREIEDALVRELAALEKPMKGKRDEAAILRVKTDLKIHEGKTAELLDVNEASRLKDLADLKKKADTSERQIDAGRGQRHLAEIKRIDDELNEKKKIFVLNGMMAEAAAIEATRPQRHAAAEYDELYTDLAKKIDVLKLKEQELTDEVKAGTKTQMEAEMGVWQIRQEIGRQIDAIIEKLRALAAESGNERLLKQAGELARTAKANLTTLSPQMLQVKGVVQGAFEGMFKSIGEGAKSAKTIIKDFILSIERSMMDIISKNLAEKLANSLFGTGGGGGGGGDGGGGLLGSFFNAGIFGGNSIMDLGRMAMSPGYGDIAGLAAGVPMFASGIDRVPSDMLAGIHKDEAVLNSRDAAAYRAGTLGGQGGGSMAVSNTFVLSNPTDTRTQSQIATLAAQSLKNARRNM